MVAHKKSDINFTLYRFGRINTKDFRLMDTFKYSTPSNFVKPTTFVIETHPNK